MHRLRRLLEPQSPAEVELELISLNPVAATLQGDEASVVDPKAEVVSRGVCIWMWMLWDELPCSISDVCGWQNGVELSSGLIGGVGAR